MNSRPALAFVLLAWLAAWPCAAADATDEATLHVTEHGDSYELSVPLSRLIMSFPKGGFQQENKAANGAAQSSRYFYFHDKKRGLVMSGWFEPSSAYSGFERTWTGEKASWQAKSLPLPKNEKRFKSNGWDGVAYDIQLPPEYAINNSHLRAFLVRDGTWLDVHISLTSTEKPAALRKRLLEFLKSIQVRTRS